MGHVCPICKTYQPQISVETADRRPAQKASDVIAFKLGCGHTIGGEKYQAFLAARAKIIAEAASKRFALEAETREKLAAAWKILEEPTGD